ncbi:MAG: ATP-dependent Lhr-like helicase [Granulosicoccus sp.]|jgi:ATP-dependent Lhr-like helicase
MNRQEAIAHSEDWFAVNQWTVFDFQREAWNAWHRGESGLIHSPTGSGKTLAAWLGPVQSALQQPHNNDTLRVLWVTPLRALANDTRQHLEDACTALGADIRVDIRTGDTSTANRTRQRDNPPYALVTTPESLSIMLSYPGAEIGLSGIHTVIVDEWHELMGSKRGVQLQLCIARLRRMCKPLRIWGVSATLANLDEAVTTLLGPNQSGLLIRGVVPKAIQVESILPLDSSTFKWSGHVGLQLLEPVINAIKTAGTTLLFTNTRSQAEIWFQALLQAEPDWVHTLALHHGSLDRDLRRAIEERLKTGQLLCVVCTSSLDLGVDFSPVDQVLQIGSPKGVARTIQRAGRSGHQPGSVSRILCVPTNALEIIEIDAVRRALIKGRIEGRHAPKRSLDVLSQHLVTIASGSGFEKCAMLAEIRSTDCFSEISDSEWQWVLDFICRGGQALQGYPQYRKVLNVAGTHRVMNKEVQQRHRLSIGTISSNTQMSVAFRGGKRLGSTEESFIARLKPGDTFQFSGRQLELLTIKEMTAYVRKSTKRSKVVPRWGGAQLPLTSELADSVQETLALWKKGDVTSPELECMDTVLQLQQHWSFLPGPNDFLIEHIKTHEGHSLFFFPFAGRLAHEGLSMVIAQRLSADTPMTFTLQINDYGFELQSPTKIDIDIEALKKVFTIDNLLDDILTSINSGEIAKRRFRDIARIAGLVFDGYPGRSKSARQVQASSGLIFDVLRNYDADNLLLEQAHREVLDQQLEYTRLAETLIGLTKKKWRLEKPAQLTPLSFPLWADSLNSQTLSSMSFQQRIESMLKSLEDAAATTLDN